MNELYDVAAIHAPAVCSAMWLFSREQSIQSEQHRLALVDEVAAELNRNGWIGLDDERTLLVDLLQYAIEYTTCPVGWDKV